MDAAEYTKQQENTKGELENDLFWYAFNYRNCSSHEAGSWLRELYACVDRLIVMNGGYKDDRK